MQNIKNRRQTMRTMVTVAVFCAVAYVCQFVFRINVAFLTFDAKDAVMTVGAMLFGPIWGIVMSALVAFLEIPNSGTGWYGFIMNFLSSAAFVCVAAWIYRYKRTMLGAILGLFSAVIAMTALMMLFNLIVTPFYMGVERSEVAAMIPTLFLPFNAVKALFNAGLVLVLYKPISTALKKAKLVHGEIGTMQFDSKTIAVLVGGVLLVAVCVVVFVFLLNGSFEWGPALDKAA